MDSNLVAVFVAGVITTLALVFGYTQWRKGQNPVVPTPPGPSPTQKKEDARVTEAIERAKQAKIEAEKLAGEERKQAVEQFHAMIVEESRNLADDPEALNAYLIAVGKELRDGG